MDCHNSWKWTKSSYGDIARVSISSSQLTEIYNCSAVDILRLNLIVCVIYVRNVSSQLDIPVTVM